jgi:hypothetical protein
MDPLLFAVLYRLVRIALLYCLFAAVYYSCSALQASLLGHHKALLVGNHCRETDAHALCRCCVPLQAPHVANLVELVLVGIAVGASCALYVVVFWVCLAVSIATSCYKYWSSCYQYCLKVRAYFAAGFCGASQYMLHGQPLAT